MSRRMRFVDLGSGIFGRATALGIRHKRSDIVGVDKKKIDIKVINEGFAKDSREDRRGYRLLENVEFVGRGGRSYLNSQNPGSIDILNMDLSARTKVWVDKNKSRGAKMFIDVNVGFFKTAFKKLSPRGRIYLTVYSSQLEGIIKNLEKAGFKTKYKNLAELAKSSVKGPYSSTPDIERLRKEGNIKDLIRIEAKKPIIGKPRKPK